MKRASKTLGIIGSLIALIWFLVFIIISLNFRGQGHPWLVDDIPPGEIQTDSGVVGEVASLIAAVLALMAGALGLCGSLWVARKPVSAGTVMLIAAFLSLVSYYNVFSFLLFLLGAVFAFVKDKGSAS